MGLTATMPRLANPAFWKGKRVLLTGHSGFKGAWLLLWLQHLGAEVVGLSLPPEAESLYTLIAADTLCQSHFVDIREAEAVKKVVGDSAPQIVFHLAAQALVRESYKNPAATFATNVMGTVNVLDALRGISTCKAAVMVTTDKVYANREWCWPYRENDALGGHDPYSASKAACELAIASYRLSFLSAQGVAVASARAGNVIGGGDFSVDRLLPDAYRAWSAGKTLNLRNPGASRPWQHVLESLNAYLCLAETLWTDDTKAAAWNFGPDTRHHATTAEVITEASKHWQGSRVHFAEKIEGPHEAGLLALDNHQAKAELGIAPCWDAHTAIEKTLGWYRAFHEGVDARRLCEKDMASYGANCGTSDGAI